MKRKFWNWVKNENEDTRTLYLDGEISDETWYGDEVTPELFRRELEAESGDVIVWINSPEGDMFAAAQIYNMLMEYKGSVTVKVDALAASALLSFHLVRASKIVTSDQRADETDVRTETGTRRPSGTALDDG